jgi:hypothetical protein
MRLDDVYGEWTVLRDRGISKGKDSKPYVWCRCSCGVEKVIGVYALNAKETKRCKECSQKRVSKLYKNTVYYTPWEFRA